MSDSEYSEHKSENSCHENEDNCLWRDCLCCREVKDAISNEQFSGNICDVLHLWIKYLHFIDIIVIN